MGQGQALIDASREAAIVLIVNDGNALRLEPAADLGKNAWRIVGRTIVDQDQLERRASVPADALQTGPRKGRLIEAQYDNRAQLAARGFRPGKPRFWGYQLRYHPGQKPAILDQKLPLLGRSLPLQAIGQHPG